jgi:Barstar (barnase inhibitor)
MRSVRVDAYRIHDTASFHDVFSSALGFPGFYGRNMDARIDCMTNLDDPSAGLTEIHVLPGEVLTLIIDNARGLKSKCPEIYMALVECSAFVNWRRAEREEPAGPVLALALYA